jgi:hypothetical protein
MHKTEKFTIAPLCEFGWGGKEYQITDFLAIAINDSSKLPKISFEYFSNNEIQILHRSTYIIIVYDNHPVYNSLNRNESVSEIINQFQILLWISRPTELFIPFRFRNDDTDDYSKFMDRFHYNNYDKDLQLNIKNNDLLNVSHWFPELITIRNNGKRLNSAMSFTFYGCVSIQWSVSYVCFCSALETLLVSNLQGDTEWKLAASFGYLLSRDLREFNINTHQFIDTYRIRNEIVHGRLYDRKNSKENLSRLGELTSILRKTWSCILNNPEICSIFDSDDKVRTDFLLCKKAVIDKELISFKEKQQAQQSTQAFRAL